MATTTYTHDNDTVVIKTDVGSGTLTGRANVVFQGADNSETGRLGNKNTTDDNITLKAEKSELVLESENEKITLSPGANKLVKVDVDAQTYANQCLNGGDDTVPNKRYVDNMIIGDSTQSFVKKAGDLMTGSLTVKHNNWPSISVISTSNTDAYVSLKAQNGYDWTFRNDDSASNRLDIRINNAQRAYIYEDISGTSRWGNLYQTAGETRLGTYLSGDNDIRLKFNSGTGTNAVGFQIKRSAGTAVGDVDYRNTGNGNHVFYTNDSIMLKVRSNTSVTSRGNLYIGDLDSTAGDKAVNFNTDSTNTPTAFTRKRAGINGNLDIVNKGTGTFSLYTNNKQVLRTGSNGVLTTLGNLHLGWNNQSTDASVKLVLNASASTSDTFYIKRSAGTNGILELVNVGTGYTHINTGGKLRLESTTGNVYRSGTGDHSFEDGYIKHADHPNWTAFGTFSNSWGNYGGPFQDCEYYKDAMGFVHIRGLLKRAGTHPNSVVKILPAGFRPAKQEIFSVEATGSPRRVDIYASGDILVYSGSGDYVSLAGITFYVG